VQRLAEQGHDVTVATWGRTTVSFSKNVGRITLSNEYGRKLRRQPERV
jgi:hypothetical protein